MIASLSVPGTRLLLVRHGETIANREYRYIGVRDDPLSTHGQTQAVQLAEALAVLPVAAVYSSPLQRAYQTALAIAARHTLEVQTVDELCECSLARSSEDAQRLSAWERDTAISPPEGESFEALRQRVCTAVNRLAQLHPDQTIALVSHVGPIKILLCAALDAPTSSIFRIFLDPATISVVDWRDRGPSTVRLINSHAHLGWERARWM